jgi:hypothetical protein
MEKNLVAYCGIYCGACSYKVAYDEKKIEHIMNMPTKYDKYKSLPLEFCPGCKEDNECGTCAIRECARTKELEHCGLCSEYPCNKITEFTNDGIPHHAETKENLRSLMEIGVEKWLQEQKNAFTCPCGEKFSLYLKECEKCNK